MSKPRWKRKAAIHQSSAEYIGAWDTHVSKNRSKARKYWTAEAARELTKANRIRNRRGR